MEDKANLYPEYVSIPIRMELWPHHDRGGPVSSTHRWWLDDPPGIGVTPGACWHSPLLENRALKQ